MGDADQPLPKDPNAEIDPFSEEVRDWMSRTVSFSTEIETKPERFEGELEMLSAEFEWNSADPHPDGYALTSVTYEPGTAPESELHRVLRDHIKAYREAGYAMADLPEDLPTNP